ncbi:hypothetical protein ACGFU4_17200 [Streptomyces sp. NPDC048511]|uniref:hypothetical protein n=1 Tax=Streptomyces sp. NPDC048511 TaxID=3365562 RepID=UPI003715BC12
MGWRDRLRRRAADPSAADPDQGAPGTPGAAAPDAPGPSSSDAQAPSAPSVPGDWDGGWRRTAAPELTVSRAPLGVSDGLAFRAGLAAWQNPSFGSGLGHALLPAAPAGLVHGVTRPAAPRATHTAGGPLLLRAVRPDATDGADAVTADGAPEVARRPVAGDRKPGSAGPRPGSSAVRPSGDSGGGPRAGKAGPGDAAPRSRELTVTESPAVLAASPATVQRAVQPGTGPVVAPVGTGRPPVAARTPLVRRVAVVPPAGAARPLSDPTPGRASVARSTSGDRTPSAPAARDAAAEAAGPRPEPSRTSGADGSHAAVRPSSSGPRLTVARRPSGPVRRVVAVRPAPSPAPPRDAAGTIAGARADSSAPVQRTATRTDSSGTATPDVTSTDSSSTARPDAPVQRAVTPSRGRAPLGAPLSELPSTAEPFGRSPGAPGAGSAPGPALPVVQRQGDTPVPYDSGTSATGGAASAGAADAPRRTPAPDGSGARVRGGLGAPLPGLPPSAALPGPAPSPVPRTSPTGPGPDVQRAPGGEAQLLGTADVQRALAEHSTTGATPVPHGEGPATPLVTTPAVAPGRPEPANPAATEGAAAAGKAPGGASAGRRPGPDVQRADRPASGGHRADGPASGGHLADGPRSGGHRADGPASGGHRTDGPRSGGHRADGSRSGGQHPHRPAAPGPVVVARAVAPGSASTRSAGSADPRPLTLTGSAAPATAPRSLSLLAARPLTLSFRTPAGAPPPSAARSGGRPVVAARWPGAPAAAEGDTTPLPGTPAHRGGPSAVSPAASAGRSGTPARPLTGPYAPAPGTPQLQRAVSATAHLEPQGTRGAPPEHAGRRTSGAPASVQRVPVVRPVPPRPVTTGTAIAVPAKSLPVTGPQAPPLADRPAGPPARAGSLPGPLPTVRPRTVAPGAADPVQRDAVASAADPLKGVQGKEIPARGRPRSSSAPPAPTSASASTSGKAASRRRPERPQDDPGSELDDLARRLIDPVSRLLRAELRRGRERTGRPYDRRR